MPTEEAPRLQPVIPACNKAIVSSPRQGGRLPMEPLSVRIPCPSDPPPPVLVGGGGAGDVLLGKKNASTTGSAQLKPLETPPKPSPSPPPLPGHSLSSPTLQDPIFGNPPSLAKKSVLVDPLPVHPASPTGGSPPPVISSNGMAPYGINTTSGGSNILDSSSTGLGMVLPPPTGSTSSGNVIGDALRPPPPASKIVPSRRHHVVPPVQPVVSSTTDGSTTTQKRPSRVVNASGGDTVDANALLAVKYTPVNPKTLILSPVRPAKNTEKQESDST